MGNFTYHLEGQMFNITFLNVDRPNFSCWSTCNFLFYYKTVMLSKIVKF